ncbi:hypothetical protein ACFQV2_22635 [Actinokineospora soli]|uniref:ROK family protein n=1 Tax=Actinokineospora soli TaxID=1048753 RepID=A0ABW2TR62_9PSEU
MAAAEYDAVAAALVSRLADEVHALGSVIIDRLHLAETEVVLAGGVLTADHPLLSAAVRERYAASHPNARLVLLGVPPILGAVRLGLDRIGAPRSAHDRACAELRGGLDL